MKNYREMADDVLRRAEEERQSIRRRRRTAWMIGAPALCAAVALAAVFWPKGGKRAALQSGQLAQEPSAQTVGSEAPPQTGDPEDGAALFIPAFRLPESEDGVAADMIAFVVYRGAIYTEAGWYRGAEAETIRPLVGDYIGTAKGNIDEWSSQEEYAAELAGSVAGKIYTVQGYSPDFRLCHLGEYTTADGKTEPWILFLERLNGIGVTTGADLYSERLHAEGRIVGARYQLYDDWNYGREIRYPLQAGPELDGFLAALNEGCFQYVYDDDPGFYRNTRAQAMLYLDLDDGTTVRLRLIEGGWVGYEPMPWYFVQLPDEVFDPIFRKCTG